MPRRVVSVSHLSVCIAGICSVVSRQMLLLVSIRVWLAAARARRCRLLRFCLLRRLWERFGLDDDVVTGRDSPRDRNARAERALHVPDELVARVLAGKVQPPDAVPQRRTHRGHLPRRREGVPRHRPGIAGPIYEPRRHEVVLEARVHAFELLVVTLVP